MSQIHTQQTPIILLTSMRRISESFSIATKAKICWIGSLSLVTVSLSLLILQIDILGLVSMQVKQRLEGGKLGEETITVNLSKG